MALAPVALKRPLIWTVVALIWLPALSVVLSLAFGAWACRTHEAARETCTVFGTEIGDWVHVFILPIWLLPFTVPLMVVTVVIWLLRGRARWRVASGAGSSWLRVDRLALATLLSSLPMLVVWAGMGASQSLRCLPKQPCLLGGWDIAGLFQYAAVLALLSLPVLAITALAWLALGAGWLRRRWR